LRDNPGGYLKEAVNMLSQIFSNRRKIIGVHRRFA
jgi:C-terminal processing protease CtpA/Prc